MLRTLLVGSRIDMFGDRVPDGGSGNWEHSLSLSKPHLCPCAVIGHSWLTSWLHWNQQLDCSNGLMPTTRVMFKLAVMVHWCPNGCTTDHLDDYWEPLSTQRHLHYTDRNICTMAFSVATPSMEPAANRTQADAFHASFQAFLENILVPDC